ncbi:hypothetical protein PC116_g21935 [Phytophthora cactorum]|uniref:Uncharacterized protein n=1 Tax=Phytophthora cactorum TaxID=29920 RepID=A0A8T1BYT7_9STRA|nr:hypothetical protein Pcac1_g3409 [Phytophthora cactorum]KAG2885764.1 hypothetical protein PC114_g19548 [Phytophthora cactorum]KAG2911664.1 hypothetical protein PC117_g19102 [Phytophthora cactorum]KAG2991089.1 hypothetical protein PC119_g18987 [Phytophthora cactorum]KAG3140673.1 hypothetical protein C6341_g19964 [Phytophthora cactorum]
MPDLPHPPSLPERVAKCWLRPLFTPILQVDSTMEVMPIDSFCDLAQQTGTFLFARRFCIRGSDDVHRSDPGAGDEYVTWSP